MEDPKFRADILFDPWGGHSFLPRWHPKVQSYITDREHYRDALYYSRGLKLMQLAQDGEDNPLNKPEYYDPGLDAEFNKDFPGRMNHRPYEIFIRAMNLDLNNKWNYEPNYLEALMITHDWILDRVKADWLALPPEQREIEQLLWLYAAGPQ